MFKPPMLLPPNPKDVEACRMLQRKHGTSYFFATKFLPKDRHWAVHALYAFFRVPDEIVDQVQGDDAIVIEGRLHAWKEAWHAVRAGESTNDPVLRLTNQVFQNYSIPDVYAEAFFASMESDIRLHRFETYEEVRQYMYGSAAVVGRMMTHVLGYTSDRAFEQADALGYAMQWTNFLRDIHEDWQERRRIYLPQDRLRAHSLSESDIANAVWSEHFSALMKEEIERADVLYDQAEQGIRFLQTGGLGVLVASRLYQAILRRLEAQDRNPFLGRARTSQFHKLVLAGRAVYDYRSLRNQETLATI